MWYRTVEVVELEPGVGWVDSLMEVRARGDA